MHRAVEKSWLSQLTEYLRANPDALRATLSEWRQPRAPLAQSQDADGGKERAPAPISEGSRWETS